LSADTVLGFLRSVEKAKNEEVPADGLGRHFCLRSSTLDGLALVWDRAIVHLTAFANTPVHDQAYPAPDEALAPVPEGLRRPYPPMDAATAAKVAQFGEVASFHRGGRTRKESLAWRREKYGGDVQHTASLFGKDATSGKIAWMTHQPDGRTRDSDRVHLTQEGERIASLWEAIH
jgi:hypothetical protein